MLSSWRRPRFDLLELVLASALVGACLWAAGVSFRIFADTTNPEADREVDRLRRAYGPAHDSQFFEEWIIRDFFKDRRGGVFVDVGANHYRHGSTTYALETRLGWSGVALDPQPAFEADYVRHRPRTRYFPFFVSDESNQTARLYMSAGDTQTVSANRSNMPAALVRELDAPTMTLNDLLALLGISHVDFVSIDVELAEPRVLAGFDIATYGPGLVCIEAHAKVRQQILEYFASHGYVVVGRYLPVDAGNLYFMPLAAAR